ncbi:uncharacterized protein EDB91DRAFT_1084794 [Suillus paluster]|uniref:uncharacterized protein n=1 Tax=Suillus paluster TaxID=48578 RepID=UPI001B88105C|nr:uncharacterized protein EDB91DRAFT_1084794 [Suillus paluster]KAG1732181.1 hypothetical protein EDB91DRAFT_1084794 [Suillus paluster]
MSEYPSLNILLPKAIYMVSGDKELLETGQTTKISYCAYHKFYYKHLMMGGVWACQVPVFFNQALFPSTSSLTPAPVLNEGDPAQSWELDFERAIDKGGEPPVIRPVIQPDLNPAAILNPSESNSISTAMEALALAHGQENIDEPVADDSGVLATTKPKPKWKGKGKQAATAVADGDLSANTGVQRSNRHGKEI